MKTASDLDSAIRQVCPIIGVSIGSYTDKGSWRIDFDPSANPAQISNANYVLSTFDFNGPDVPASISDRQFFQQLAVVGVITQDEALAAVKTGTIPVAMQALVAGLPADQQFGAEMLLSGATIFYRNHPLTISFGNAYGWTPSQIDDFFIAAGNL